MSRKIKPRTHFSLYTNSSTLYINFLSSHSTPPYKKKGYKMSWWRKFFHLLTFAFMQLHDQVSLFQILRCKINSYFSWGFSNIFSANLPTISKLYKGKNHIIKKNNDNLSIHFQILHVSGTKNNTQNMIHSI